MSNSTHLNELAVSETGFVFDPYSGATFSLNRTGLLLLHAMRSGMSISQIEARMNEMFEGDTKYIRDDVFEFVRMLKVHGLVASDFAVADEPAP